MHDDDIEPPRPAGTVLPSWGARREESLDDPAGRSTTDGPSPTGASATTLIDGARADDWTRPVAERTEGLPVPPPVAAPAASATPAPPARRRPIWLIVPVMVLSTAAVIYVLGRTSGPRPAGVPPKKVTPTTAASTVPAPATSTTRALPSSSTSAATTTVVVTTTSALVVSTTVAASTASTIKASSGESAGPTAAAPRSAIFRDGKVYLLGAVPSREVADAVIAKAAAVVGPANVVDQYDIVPGTPAQSASPLRIADTVLFDPESDVIRPEFKQLLDLGVVLMKQNPAVTVTVTGHTDSQGGVAMNQRLAQRRVDNVIAYFVRKGIDSARLTGVSKGQADPIADNATVAGRQLNRRIEFVIEHLLG
jgi:outer membrane protein OmpA-like peptidoglycan-associated protein